MRNIWISVLLFTRLGCILYLSLFFASVRAQDSIRLSADTTTLKDSLPENPLATARGYLQQWRQQLDKYYAGLDSVKRNVAWQRQQQDLSTPRQAGEYIDRMLPNLNRLQHKIKLFRNQTIPQDSTATVWRAVQDSATVLDQEAEALQMDLAELAMRVRQQQQLLQSERSDPFWGRWLALMHKNLEQDGLSMPYVDQAWDGRFLLLLVSLAYLYWLYRMRRQDVGRSERLPLHRNQPWWIPILKLGVFFLIALPLTSFRIPVLVLELSYLLIFSFLYLLTRSELPTFKIRVMRLVFLYYIALLIVNLLLGTDLFTRSLSVIVNIFGIGLIWALGRKTANQNPLDHLNRLSRWALLVIISLSVIFHIAGFMNLARTCAIAGGIGLLQALSLRGFRDMLAHDVLNSYENAEADRFVRRLDKFRLIATVRRITHLFTIILVIIVWTNSLHLTSKVRRVVEHLLNTSHHIGSITYTYGDVLLAVAVVAMANWIQKNLKELLDQPGAQNNQRRIALLPLVRVLVFIIGFLIGIRILGLGIDKLTVIVGALSVGIGLGLQNIINNFVSGVILVFERPFKVGDYIELADKKGQVKQVGIRSSTLLTDQGAQVIIPNGDLLSGRLVNWTFEESDIRLNLQLTFTTARHIEKWKSWLENCIHTFPEIDRAVPIKILTKDIAGDAYVLFVQVGIHNVQQIENFRSKFLEQIKAEAAVDDSKVSSA